MKLAAGIYIALATCMALLAEAPRLLPPLDLPPYRLQFSPDGHFLLAKSRRGRAVLLGSQTYLQYLECPADTHSFVRNGKSLLVWARGKPARLYSPRDMSLQKTLDCDVLTYMSAAPAIAELPGIGLLVASESSDGRPIEGRSVLDVHELESGKVTKIRGLSGLGIRWLTFLDDGDFLVGMGSSADKAELLRWDRESEKLLWQIPFVHENFALGKDKRLAFAHFSGQSRGQPPVIIDVEAGKQLRCYPKAFVARMSPDGRVLATLESVRSSKKLFPGFELPEQLHVSRSSQDKRSWRGMIRLHDSQSMQELASFPISQTPFAFCVVPGWTHCNCCNIPRWTQRLGRAKGARPGTYRASPPRAHFTDHRCQRTRSQLHPRRSSDAVCRSCHWHNSFLFARQPRGKGLVLLEVRNPQR
jgi:hypothetical protein